MSVRFVRDSKDAKKKISQVQQSNQQEEGEVNKPLTSEASVFALPQGKAFGILP